MSKILFSPIYVVTILSTINSFALSPDRDSNKPGEPRLISLGGGVTEILFAIEMGKYVVGVDASSSYPPKVKSLPQVAYHRRLSAEGIISLHPSMVIATTEAGPPEVLQQLRDADVELIILPHEPTIDSTLEKIKLIGQAVHAQSQATNLINKITLDIDSLLTHNIPDSLTAKVLFLYARGQGNIMVAGTKTGANEIIKLAGAKNAISEFEGYKPLTSEAVISSAPDVILLMDSGLQSLGGTNALWELPGMALTPAKVKNRVLTMDGLLLLGFGPRIAEAAQSLHESLYPDSTISTSGN